MQLDFFNAWHWPTGLADDSREVGFLTRASNLSICCTVFPGPVTGLLGRAACFLIWAFCNRVFSLCFVSGCHFSRLKPLLRQGSLVLTPGGLKNK